MASVTLTPTATRVETYLDLLEGVWPNNIYLGTVVDTLLPYDFDGSEFTLEASEVGVSFTIVITRPSDPDAPDRTNVPVVIRHINKNHVEQLRLPLSPGVNNVELTSTLGNVWKRLGVAHYATALYVQGFDLDNGVVNRLRQREWAALSPTGSLLVERWFRPYADLLPHSNALHRLAMRAVIDGFSNATTGDGIESLAAAITGNNPVITNILTDPDVVDGASDRYRWAEDFAGVDFDVWLLDVCSDAFVAAGHYMQNFPELWEIQDWGESRIAFQRISDGEADGQTRILRNFESDGGCAVEDYAQAAGCFDRIRPWVRLDIPIGFIVCYAMYGLDTAVEVCYALGTVYWDCERHTLAYTVHDADAVDLEDPTGDGWVGEALDGRWDYPYGSGWDTLTKEAEDFLSEEIDCPYEKGPVTTPLMTQRSDSTVTVAITGTATLAMITGGPIIQPSNPL